MIENSTKISTSLQTIRDVSWRFFLPRIIQKIKSIPNLTESQIQYIQDICNKNFHSNKSFPALIDTFSEMFPEGCDNVFSDVDGVIARSPFDFKSYHKNDVNQRQKGLEIMVAKSNKSFRIFSKKFFLPLNSPLIPLLRLKKLCNPYFMISIGIIPEFFKEIKSYRNLDSPPIQTFYYQKDEPDIVRDILDCLEKNETVSVVGSSRYDRNILSLIINTLIQQNKIKYLSNLYYFDTRRHFV